VDLPKEVLDRIWRGAHPTRAGDILYVPAGWNFLSGGISHSVPWPYMQRVPMVWYGPGVIRQGGKVDRPVTSADVAPTLASLTGVSFETPDGAPMEEVLEPDRQRPRLVVVFVWDAGGRYVLDLWPDRWPNLARMMREGTWYEHATVGSSPSTTAPIHATIGTGTFPRTHGVLDNYIRFEDGRVGDPWSQGPGGMLVPTFADVYEEATNHQANLGLLSTVRWHLGMMGHGRQGDPGSRQLAVLREASGDSGKEGIEWGLQEVEAEYYRFPEYIRDLPPLSSYLEAVDRSDGTLDGTWMGHPFDELRGGFHSPARIPYQQRAVEEIVRREGFGADDDTTDLLFINSKLIDEVGHADTASGEEMGEAIRAQDAGLPPLIEMLDRLVGRGRWALLITADHGHTADPAVTGGFRVSTAEMERTISGLFESDGVVERIRPSWMFVDAKALRREDGTLADLSTFIDDMNQAHVTPDPSTLSTNDRGRRVFAQALPLELLNTYTGG
jgi:hypothetical protein